MTVEIISIWISIGLIAGQMAAAVVRGFGGLGDTIVGIVGACMGGLVFSRLHIPTPFRGTLSTVFVALIGALFLLVLLRLLRKGWVARNG